VKPLPRSDPNVGRVEVRTLLGQLEAPFFGALVLFVR
jgi:hypothetical protein